MQCYIMLAVSLGMPDADDSVVQVNIRSKQHPCLFGTHAAAVQEAEENRKHHRFTACLYTFSSWTVMVASPKKIYKFVFADWMGQTRTMLLSRGLGRDKGDLSAGIQIQDKIDDDIDPGTV